MPPFFVFNGRVSSLEKHSDWKAALTILQTLVDNGHRALIAGGAVRDLLLGREANDIDIGTSATPEQVEALFEKTVMVGRQFGVSRVILQNADIEVATFRKDGPYKDGRKPESVQYSSEQEDAHRRDFTINGMFYDPLSKKVVDFVQGQEDLNKKIIRAIGDPQLRFEEDKLRILRAVRFHSQLNFTIEKETFVAISKHAPSISQVSIERVRDEWQKLLLAQWAVKGFHLTQESGLWQEIFPGWNFLNEEYSKKWVGRQNDKNQAWIHWFLLHNDNSQPWIKQEAGRLKLPSQLTQAIVECQRLFDSLSKLENNEPVDSAIALDSAWREFATRLYRLLKPGKTSEAWEGKLSEALSFYEQGQLPEPLLGGKDLIAAGQTPGPQMAGELRRLYCIQLTEKITDKAKLLTEIT